MRVCWRVGRFGFVVEGLEKGALISCFREGESLDMLGCCLGCGCFGWRGIDEEDEERCCCR